MIYNLTEALDSVELKNEELQKKLEVQKYFCKKLIYL